MVDEETKMLLVVNGQVINVTYKEAERIYHRLSKVFNTSYEIVELKADKVKAKKYIATMTERITELEKELKLKDVFKASQLKLIRGLRATITELTNINKRLNEGVAEHYIENSELKAAIKELKLHINVAGERR